MSQFSFYDECRNYMEKIPDDDRIKECMQIIYEAKKIQEEKARKNAWKLLEQISEEKVRCLYSCSITDLSECFWLYSWFIQIVY